MAGEPEAFDAALLLLLDVEGERLLAAWALVRRDRPRRSTEQTICGWTFDADRWRELADASHASLARYVAIFDGGGFILEDGGLDAAVAGYLRRRVAERLRPAPKGPR